MEMVKERPQTKKKKKDKPPSELLQDVPKLDSGSDTITVITEGLKTTDAGSPLQEKQAEVSANVAQALPKDQNIPPEENGSATENVVKHDVKVLVQSAVKATTVRAKENPIVEVQDEFQKLLSKSKDIVKDIKLTDFTQVEQKTDETVTGIFIKPYTESQLSSLYHNSELETLEPFITQYVEAELKGLSIKRHPLYDLLSNYLRVREKITGNNLELDQIRKEYGQLQQELWTIETASVTGRGECQDGVALVTSHSYSKSIFHRSVFQSIIRILGNVQKLTYENHTLYTYSAEDLRLQIELYLQSVISNTINVTQLDRNAPVALSVQGEPPHLKPYLAEVRLCISILFAFQRKLLRETQFIKETRAWLSQLIAVLLRMSNYQDHLFILNHILRCPAGIGSWASHFLQTPLSSAPTADSPFANYEMNHLLTVLATILSPIHARERFLEEISQNANPAGEAVWVMVDSDGEEDEESTGTSLKENDLVALLNQLPWDGVFRSALLVTQRNFEDVYNASLVTEHHLLRYLAFSTVLLKILHKGIQTYDQPRYNQFSKRLSRFIRHVAQYSTDQWEQFLRVQDLEDKAMLLRLQVEYDAFFLRAIYYLYSSQKLGAWQFLAVVPYNMVTLKTLWKIFYFLHSSDNKAEDILNPLDEEDYSKKLWEEGLRAQFEDKLGGLEDAEVYYLLNTFANMVLARGPEDMDFIFSATMDLLKIGFISETTRESCSKSARILLTHITSKYPHLLSNILKEAKHNIEAIGNLVLYLYEELPLSVWKITEFDLQTISRLLMSASPSAVDTKLARMILSRLNWDAIPYDFHCDVAVLVVSAVLQVPTLEHWGWQMIMRLKLHVSDKAFTELGRVQEIERYDVLMAGFRRQHTLAIFVALLMTSWGHLVPLIGTKGFSQLLYLQYQQKHEAVLFVLYQIVPLFLNSQECLINCERYQEILLNLLNSDRGYISMAKSLVFAQNTVLQQFGNMVETQIISYETYGLDSPRSLVRVWTNSLVSIPSWNKDMGIMYLLDVIIRAAFLHPDTLEVVRTILREQQQLASPQDSSGTISSLFKWVASTNTNGSLISNSLSNYTWLAYMMITVEHAEREAHTGLWNEILVQLSKQKGKVSIDQAIKKASGVVKVTSFTSGFLCLYRWAQQALDTPLDHPLLPLLWQNFFSLYLARIPTTSVADRSCVGEKFFDGLVNFAFFKKIKRRLQESVEYFQSRLDVKDEENKELEKKEFYQACHKVFRAFLLWLEEPRLQENHLLLKSLPPQYEPGLLMLIIQSDNTPWYKYLDYDRLKKEQQTSVRAWRVANFREKSNVNMPLLNAGSRVESDDPVERILRRLASYDAPKPPPSIKLSAPVVPNVEFGCKEEMLKSLEQCFATLKQFAHNHLLKLSEHKALDCAYQELAPQLYRSVPNKVKRKVPCRGRNQTVNCSGAAVIVLEMQEARINDRIAHQIETNRNTYQSLLSKALQSTSINLCSASVAVQQTIKALQQQLRCNPATQELGVELFYHILSLINEETSGFPPTKTLFSSCLEKLGQSHISIFEYEMPRLLQKILNETSLGEYLAPHFSPSNVGTSNLLLMYSTICKEIGQKYDITFALISKFEIDNWLQSKHPKLSQRSEFIQSVIKALTTLGFDPAVDALMLHGLYRKHLLTVFEYQFPEHYGEVLMQLLKASNGSPESTNLLALSVWMDVFNSLAQPAVLILKAPLRDQLRHYAQHQRVLQHQELLQTAELLSRHFTQERLQYGLYGLYPKCRNYMDVYALFLGVIGHGIVVSMLDTHQGLLGDKLCEKMWPFFRDMFSPWLVPYSMQNLKENMASWIQQLADDRSVLLPWIPPDAGFAQKILNSFRECVAFMIHALPASSSILSYIWQWYVTCYVHASVKGHILLPVHETFLQFPWHNFWPSVVDVEFMLRIIDQYLPECHAFLGHIFMSIPWSNWLNNFRNAPPQLRCRVYQCFINLIVKLSNEPNVRKNYSQQAKSLLIQAENMDWTVLEPPYYQHVMDWVVLSADSSVIFKSDPLDLDHRVLSFLKTVSGYTRPLSCATPEHLFKRLIYVKTHIKLLSIYANRHKNAVYHKEQDIYLVISRQLGNLETVVDGEEEMTVLLRELVCVLNIANISGPATRAFTKWIENKPSNGIVMRSLLKCLGQAVKDNDTLAELFEVTINSYFTNTVSDDFKPSWREVGELLNILVARQNELEQASLNKSCLLTLNAIFVQRISKCNDPSALLNLCLDWTVNAKLNESIEPKMPLLWSGFLMLVLQHSDKDEPYCGAVLHKFSEILLHISEDKGSGRWGMGLLTKIGLSKQDSSLSVNFRFLCRALAGYVLAQLPEMKGEPQVIRRAAGAPAKVGQPGGNTECVKVLLTLDFGQSQGKIKECAELALKQIQDPSNSLHNVRKFVNLLVQQFYTKSYLKDMVG